MLISQTAEYSLRAMAHLAAAPPGTPVPSADLAAVTGIPPHYVSKVLRRLVIAGLCDARRGHHGGFRLTRPPEQITFAEVITAADPEQGPIGCAFGYGRCDLANPCPLHESWSELKREFATWSENTTLAQVRDYAARPEVSFRRTPRPD